jgi:hypothetical protein
MKPSRGYYSLIQYCPDLGRLEAANVGVILFCPERGFLKALTARSNRRIIRFFGSEGHDWGRINAFKKGIEDRLRVEQKNILTVEDFEKFIALRANLLQITQPRPMKVHEPQKDLENLFAELLDGTIGTKRHVGLRRSLGAEFAGAGVDSKIRRDIRIHVPVLEREVEIPYGFQNGRFNLIQPVRFEAADPRKAVDSACKYAIEGRELYEHTHPEFGDLQLVIVGQFRAQDQEAPSRVRRVLNDYHVKLYRTDELPELIDEIRRTGKDLQPIR